MKLEKTLAYLESQLKASGVELDAYQSWLNDKYGTLPQRYARYAYNYGGGPREEVETLMEALEEVHRELESNLEDYDTRTYR